MRLSWRLTSELCSFLMRLRYLLWPLGSPGVPVNRARMNTTSQSVTSVAHSHGCQEHHGVWAARQRAALQVGYCFVAARRLTRFPLSDCKRVVLRPLVARRWHARSRDAPSPDAFLSPTICPKAVRLPITLACGGPSAHSTGGEGVTNHDCGLTIVSVATGNGRPYLTGGGVQFRGLRCCRSWEGKFVLSRSSQLNSIW